MLAGHRSKRTPHVGRALADHQTTADDGAERSRCGVGHDRRGLASRQDPDRCAVVPRDVPREGLRDQRSGVSRMDGGLNDSQEIVSKGVGRMCQ
jgi:hypothetical protein